MRLRFLYSVFCSFGGRSWLLSSLGYRHQRALFPQYHPLRSSSPPFYLSIYIHTHIYIVTYTLPVCPRYMRRPPGPWPAASRRGWIRWRLLVSPPTAPPPSYAPCWPSPATGNTRTPTRYANQPELPLTRHSSNLPRPSTLPLPDPQETGLPSSARAVLPGTFPPRPS